MSFAKFCIGGCRLLILIMGGSVDCFLSIDECILFMSFLRTLKFVGLGDSTCVHDVLRRSVDH